MSCSKQLPLCELLRYKVFECRDALVRREFIRRMKQRVSSPIYCRRCLMESGLRTIIASDARRFVSKETCINPGGHIFHMVMFNPDDVPSSNVVAVGPAHSEHTWFQGFAWSFCICRRCGGHLGWHYAPRLFNRTGRPFWGFRSTEFVNEGSEESYVLLSGT